MVKLSGVIITYNEEKHLEKCLSSLTGIVDEIVVVDSFSTDNTPDICKKFNVKFISRPFVDYVDQKNFALDQCSYVHVLSLDGDEELSEELKTEILKVKENWQYDGYSFNRLNNYCGKWIKHGSWYPDTKIRLFDRRKARWGGEMIHETIELQDYKSHKKLDGNLLHWAYNSYSEHYSKINGFTDMQAHVNFAKGKKTTVLKIVVSPLWKFLNSYILKLGLLDGFQGFVISTFSASGIFLKNLKLYELHKNNQDKTKK